MPKTATPHLLLRNQMSYFKMVGWDQFCSLLLFGTSVAFPIIIKMSPERIRNTQQQNIHLPTKGDPKKEMSTIFTLDLFKRMVIVW